MASLKAKTVSGFKWLVVNNVLQRVISVATFAVLARILEPSTFGLFAMAFIAIDGLSLFKSFGLDGGIIQKKDAPEKAYHTAFFIIAAMGSLLALICFALAPLIGAFFSNGELGSIVRALGVVFIVSGFGRVPSAILTRHLRFRLISIVALVGAIVNSVFAILFALMWQNVWSLVGAYVIRHSTMAVLSWYFSGYRLKREFDWGLAGELFGFGKFLIGLSALSYLWGNISNMVIGKLLGVAAVGYYTLAANIGNFINSHFTNVISRVMFPAYSALQNDRESVAHAYLKVVKFVMMLTLPYSVALICLAQEFTLTIYGEKWLSIVPVMRFLGFVQMAAPIYFTGSPVFQGCGRPDYDFKLNGISLLFFVPMMAVLTHRFGLMGTVAAAIVNIWVFTPISVYYVHKIIGFSFAQFFKQLVPALLCSLAMFFAIFAVKGFLAAHPSLFRFELNHFVLLSLLCAVGLFTYGISYFIVDRESAIEVRNMIFKLEKA